MRYEWDERKNRENQRKHGISFRLAALVFEDESRLISLDRVDETGEQRWHALGAVSIDPEIAVLVLVAHAYREDRNGEEIIRIVSARRAIAKPERSHLGATTFKSARPAGSGDLAHARTGAQWLWFCRSKHDVRRYQEQEVD